MTGPRFQKYYMSEDHSYDSNSEEIACQYVAYFSKPTTQPTDNAETLLLRQNELLKKFPQYTLEINALLYYYGLFIPKNHTAFDPQFNHYFCFFEPSQSQLSHPEITLFKKNIESYRGIC